jgi:hypothetical protein
MACVTGHYCGGLGILDLIQWIKSALRGDRIRTAVSDRGRMGNLFCHR